MNTTTIEHRPHTVPKGTVRRRIRRHVGIAVLVIASAGVGAVAQHGSADRHVNPVTTVAQPRCTSLPSGTHIETMQYLAPTQRCASRPVLVSDRA